MIYHFCGLAEWAAATDAYRADTLSAEGFIHCSDRDTVLLPANFLARGRTDLVLLAIDESRLDTPPVWEPAIPSDPSSTRFPHVYGPIAVSAVVSVHDFPCDPDGGFTALPPGLP